jgi:hypothetical protein
VIGSSTLEYSTVIEGRLMPINGTQLPDEGTRFKCIQIHFKSAGDGAEFSSFSEFAAACC